MAIDLSQYKSIQANLFCRLDIPNYQVLTFSDYHIAYTLGDTTYQGLGSLLGITNTTNSLRAITEELTLTISGIPISNINDIVSTKVKGSKLDVYRAFFDPVTGIILPISGNPAGKFHGIISNFSIVDDIQEGSQSGTLSIVLVATSVVAQLNNKISGRRTNSIDELALYPTDHCFDRVPKLAKANLNFGAA
jgi:hypothetical protein